MNYKVGIDEAGRGPLAGPLAVGISILLEDFDYLSLFPKSILKDSKKLSEKSREKIFLEILKLQKEKHLDFVYITATAEEIDQKGISKCLYDCIEEGLKKLKERYTFDKDNVTLDGALSRDFGNVVIKGDEKFVEISFASIIAKVMRDRHMDMLHEKYPEYNFAKNKGYGTAAHCEAIKKQGVTIEHRKSWLTNYI